MLKIYRTTRFCHFSLSPMTPRGGHGELKVNLNLNLKTKHNKYVFILNLNKRHVFYSSSQVDPDHLMVDSLDGVLVRGECPFPEKVIAFHQSFVDGKKDFLAEAKLLPDSLPPHHEGIDESTIAEAESLLAELMRIPRGKLSPEETISHEEVVRNYEDWGIEDIPHGAPTVDIKSIVSKNPKIRQLLSPQSHRRFLERFPGEFAPPGPIYPPLHRDLNFRKKFKFAVWLQYYTDLIQQSRELKLLVGIEDSPYSISHTYFSILQEMESEFFDLISSYEGSLLLPTDDSSDANKFLRVYNSNPPLVPEPIHPNLSGFGNLYPLCKYSSFPPGFLFDSSESFSVPILFRNFEVDLLSLTSQFEKTSLGLYYRDTIPEAIENLEEYFLTDNYLFFLIPENHTCYTYRNTLLELIPAGDFGFERNLAWGIRLLSIYFKSPSAFEFYFLSKFSDKTIEVFLSEGFQLFLIRLYNLLCLYSALYHLELLRQLLFKGQRYVPASNQFNFANSLENPESFLIGNSLARQILPVCP